MKKHIIIIILILFLMNCMAVSSYSADNADFAIEQNSAETVNVMPDSDENIEKPKKRFTFFKKKNKKTTNNSEIVETKQNTETEPKQEALTAEEKVTENAALSKEPPKEVKKLNQKQAKKNKKDLSEEKSDIDIDSDTLEYFSDKSEIVATGNVIITMHSGLTKLYADKVVYNTDKNTIKGYGNVKLVKNNQTILGEFINVNLNEENVLVEKPSTEGNIYKISATEGYIYPGKAITTDGVISLKEGSDIMFLSPGMGDMYLEPEAKDARKSFYEKESTDPKERTSHLKAKVIYIKSMKDHDEVFVKNAAYYYKNKKILTFPRIDLTTNKSQDFVETNLPEIGSFREFGTYFGPGFVFNVPGGSVLKLAPVFQLGHSRAKHDYGIGIMGRFSSKNNLTEGMWGSANDDFVIRGRHKLTENLRLEYAHNGYMDEWFMGMRIPENLVQLTHDKTFYLEDIDTTYRNRFSAGYVSDYYGNNLGTSRFRWQTETSKTFYSNWNKEETIGVNLGVIAQTSASVYGTGDFQGMVKAGPFIGTRYKNWKQTIAYFQGSTAGQSPMIFDRYMYGKCNLVLRETLKLNKYITVGYLASLALLKDNWDRKMFQENQLFVALGPDDAKIAFGYDPVRRSLRLNYMFTLKGDAIDIPYDKMIVDDPATLGKKNKKQKSKKKKTEL